MTKSVEVKHEQNCWVILYKDVDNEEFKVHGDVFLCERAASEIARSMAITYATEFQKKAEYVTEGYDFVCRVRPYAEWRVQKKQIMVPHDG